MPGKKTQCASCLKYMRSDNLKRHAPTCSGTPVNVSGNIYDKDQLFGLKSKQSRDIITFSGYEFLTNPKSRETLNKVMQYVGVAEDRQDKVAAALIREDRMENCHRH